MRYYESFIPSYSLQKVLRDGFTYFGGEYYKIEPPINSTRSWKEKLKGILRDFLDRW
jgi:hypothetical protein